MEIALLVILGLVGLGVGVPLITMAATDFEHTLPPGKDSQNPVLPGEVAPTYEVFDPITGTYSTVPNPAAFTQPANTALTRISSIPSQDIARRSKRSLGLVTASSAPVRLRKEALDEQVSSFEKCSKALDEDLKKMFTETSLTYDVHASAVESATAHFWTNVSTAADVLKRFDAKKYEKLESELRASERLMFDSFDSAVLASQIEEAIDKGDFDIDKAETERIKEKTASAKSLAAQGKQLQARELLRDAKEMIVSKEREKNPAYIQMLEMENTLSEADGLISQNEDIIAELERLSTEIRQINAEKRAEKAESVVAEISRLSDNAHLYESCE